MCFIRIDLISFFQGIKVSFKACGRWLYIFCFRLRVFVSSFQFIALIFTQICHMTVHFQIFYFRHVSLAFSSQFSCLQPLRISTQASNNAPFHLGAFWCAGT